MPRLEPLSPEWWVHRLHKKIVQRSAEIELYDRYYRGEHPLPWLAPQAQDEFRRILKMTRSNYMGLVCDSQVERMHFEGIRVGESLEADAEMWAIWEENHLDSDFDQGLLEATIGGQAYILVAPNPDDTKRPLMWIEHPSQVIVEYAPGTGRNKRIAGLKVWQDDWTGNLHSTLQYNGWIWKFESDRPVSGVSEADKIRWAPRVVGKEQWPAKNPLEEVTFVELPNNPRLLTGGVSELHDLIDIQDRANKTVADRLMTQDYGAFPQKWAKAWPEEDANGNPTKQIDVGRDRMVTTDVKEAEFGQWDAAPLDPYSAAKREDVKDIASRSRTPAQYLLGEMSNVNGETLKASESGLVSKVRQRIKPHTEGLKDAFRLARKAAGLPPLPMEPIWKNPEFRTEGELVDSLTKMATLNVPEEALWERWGATPQERDRWRKWNAERREDPTLARINREVVGDDAEE